MAQRWSGTDTWINLCDCFLVRCCLKKKKKRWKGESSCLNILLYSHSKGLQERMDFRGNCIYTSLHKEKVEYMSIVHLSGTQDLTALLPQNYKDWIIHE